MGLLQVSHQISECWKVVWYRWLANEGNEVWDHFLNVKNEVDPMFPIREVVGLVKDTDNIDVELEYQ